MKNQDKKKALVEWLNSPITIAYYKQLQENKKELEEELVNTSRTNFVNGEVKERSRAEIEHHTNLVAIDLNLRIFIPLFEFKKWCAEQSLEIMDVPEKYERSEVGTEIKSEYSNPLDLFIDAI